MLYKEVIEIIEKIANPVYAAHWDKSGVQVASFRKEVETLAVFLDAVPENVSTALAEGADCMLCHHPLALRPELPAKLDAYHQVLSLLLKADVSLYAAHTSLDVNLAGPAGWLGRELELENKKPLDKIGDYGLGYGEVGILPEKIPSGKFICKILDLLAMESCTVTGHEPGEYIRRVAYCPGSGGSMLELAVKWGADIYITGDIKYHTALGASVPVLDVGHHSIEEEMMIRFAQVLRVQMPKMKVIFIPSKSPFRMATCRES